MKPPARIRLRLLGRLAIAHADGDAPIRLSTRKAGALIAYLAMRPEQTASREELATLLWGSSSDPQARQSLRQALVLLRKELGGAHFVMADAAVVRLPPDLWSVDAGAFDRLSQSSEPQELARAAELFEGAFLTGLNIDEEGFDEWVGAQRQRVELAAARLCETLAARPELVSDPQRAVVAVERLVALDPLREDWQRLALTLYARYRGRNEALAQADVFSETLRRELGVTPEKATRALIEKIRACGTASEDAPIELVAPAPNANAAAAVPAPISATVPALVPAPTPVESAAALSEALPAAVAAPMRWRLIVPSRRAAAMTALAGVLVIVASGLLVNHLRDARHEDQAQSLSTRAASIERWRPPASLAGSQEQPRAAIAVLPFVAQGDVATLQPAADAIAEDLINVLARVPAIRVISRATMESYRGRPIDVAAIAAELDVSYVLEGVVRAEGDRLRVNVELIDPATRSPAWSTRIERTSGRESEVRDEIVTRLARELQLGTPAIEAAQAPADPTMRQLYQQGLAAIYASGGSPEKLRESEQAFSRALARDPQSRWAKVGLANVQALEAVMMIDADIDGHLVKAEALLTELGGDKPGSTGIGFAMGLVHEMRGRPAEAIEAFRRAIAVNPSHAPSYAGVGHAMIFAGKPAEGLDYIRYALRLSPRDAQRAHWLRFAGEAELELGHYEKAIDLVRQSLALAPRQVQALRTFAVVLAAAGRMEEAHKTLADLRAANPALTDARLVKLASKYKATRLEMMRGTQLLVAPAQTADPWASPRPSSATPPMVRHAKDGVVAIAVLPFNVEGTGGDASRAAADVITNDLSYVLSRSPQLRVISHLTTGRYRDGQFDDRAIGAELQVRYLLKGSVEAEGEALRASVALTDPQQGLTVWTARFERVGGDRDTLLDEITTGLGRQLDVEVMRRESAMAAERPDVHLLIFKGYAALAETASAGLPALERAEAAFSEALARDPENPRAQTGLGAYHLRMAIQLYAADPAPHMAQAEGLLRRVLERRPTDSRALVELGVLLGGRGRTSEAQSLLERAIAANPSEAGAYAQLGRSLTREGRPAEGLEQVLYAMRLSPRDPALAYWLGFAGAAELELKDYGKAIGYLDRAVALHPTQPRTLLTRIATHAMAGRLELARSQFADLQKTLPHLTGDKLIRRFFGPLEGAGWSQLKQGLRLVSAPAPEPDRTAKTTPPTQRSGVATILVLPFTLLGEDNERSRLWADIMADDLTNAVTRVGGFRVISRQTAAGYRGKRADPIAVGSALGVQYLLNGRVEARGEGLRASIELTDTRNGSRAWSGNYERSGGDLPAIVDEIVRSVGRALQIEVTRIESGRDSDGLDVHALIYKGFAALGGSGPDPGALAQAMQYFTEARARDPNSTRAMTGLGASHVAAASRLPRAEREPHLKAAEALLHGVIERRPDVGGPSMFLGMVSYLRGQDDDAIRWFRRELERNPSQSRAYAHLGRALTRSAKPEEGLKQILYAIRLSPNDPAIPEWLAFAGRAELELGHFPKAIEYLERTVSLHTASPFELIVLAAARALDGDLVAARMRLDQAQQKSADFSRSAVTQRYIDGPTKLGEARLSEGLRLALAPARDPWASPPSPTGRPDDPAMARSKKNIPLLVLPFTSSGDTDGATQSLADMVTDDLTNLLSRVASLRVISRRTARTFKGKPIDVAALGQELQVRYVLEGTMRTHEDKLRINLELTDPATRLPVWTTRIDHAAADRDTIVDEIVGRLARELQVNLIGIEAERRSKDRDTDALVARGWAGLFNISVAGYREAEGYFREALERDPLSVPAMIGMGAYHARIGALALDNEPLVHRAKAQELLREAINRDPNSSQAHFYLGLALKRPPTLMQSIEEMERAIELNPSFPAAHVHVGHTLALTGKPEKGIEHVKYGMRLSPRDPTMGVFLDMAGDVELILDHLDAAIDDFRRSAELKPAYPRPWAGLAAAYALAGRMDEARNCVEKLKSLMPGLSADKLIEQFGRNEQSRLNQGLRLAFAPARAATARVPTQQ